MDGNNTLYSCLAIYVLIMLCVGLYIYTNEKAKARVKFMWKDKRVRNLIYFCLAGFVISIIPVFGQIIGNLMVIAGVIGLAIRANQLRGLFDRFYKDEDKNKFE